MTTFNAQDTKDKCIDFKFECEGDFCKLIYKDNAGGMSAEVLNSIFDTTFRKNCENENSGLYLSKFIIEHLNGKFNAKNIDDGIEFELFLPKNSKS